MKGAVLCVGIVVVDIVTEVDTFPREDIKTRCGDIYEVIGGNAANNCRVLSLLGETSSFMGCAGTSGHHLRLVEDFFIRYQVDMNPMVKCDGHAMPLTVCILNKGAGTRTCLHYRGSLPELTYDMFAAANISLSTYKWIHFEGRYSSEDTLAQIEHVHNQRSSEGHTYNISVELEKASKPLDFAKVMGYADMTSAAEGLSAMAREGVVVICPWGDLGVAAKATNIQVVTSAAYPPEDTVNTLAAGDTFIAACIKALKDCNDLQKSLTYACKVAGAKCGLRDLDKLKDMSFNV
ncbi:ketohexokinase-like isoform X2 [Watersipora subatra]|uniref:ketohexokinase-like isoform X2 n=1 Tax=Watersipora subatra TaxID=2589382 RepID=UPI00355C88CD